MENVRFVSDLKLRGSFGFTGNERIGNFQYLGTWASATYNGATGVGPNNLSNPNLQWERTREANVGFDASFWNGRFSATADIYSNPDRQPAVCRADSAHDGLRQHSGQHRANLEQGRRTHAFVRQCGSRRALEYRPELDAQCQ